MRFLVKMLAFLQFMDYEKLYIPMKGPAEKNFFFSDIASVRSFLWFGWIIQSFIKICN